MLIPFKIYIRAVGLYAFVTLPALVVPVMYLISIMYVLLYGWFAWGLYTIIHLIVTNVLIGYKVKMLLLSAGVVASILFAFEMLEVLNIEKEVWNSYRSLLFLTILVGWVSLCMSRSEIRRTSHKYTNKIIANMNIK